MLRNTWWSCHRAPLSSSFGCIWGSLCSPLCSYLCSVFWGTDFVSSVFLFHLAKLAVTCHPFLRKIHHWSIPWDWWFNWPLCIVEGCLKPSQCPDILDSSQTSGTVLSFFYPVYQVMVLYDKKMDTPHVWFLEFRQHTGCVKGTTGFEYISCISCSGWDVQPTVSSMLWAVVTFQVRKYFFKMSLL